jgi:hypothetical protein
MAQLKTLEAIFLEDRGSFTCVSEKLKIANDENSQVRTIKT